MWEILDLFDKCNHQHRMRIVLLNADFSYYTER